LYNAGSWKPVERLTAPQPLRKRLVFSTTCIKLNPVLHCARHCVGSDKNWSLKLWFSSLRGRAHTRRAKPWGFFHGRSPQTAPPAIAVSLHGLPEREHWPRFHPPASHATCQWGMAQEGRASG